MPIKADSWLESPVWVDWVETNWLDRDLIESDWASRAFNTRRAAEEFVDTNIPKDAWVLVYERAKAPDEEALFIYFQRNCHDELGGPGTVNDIRSGYGFRWFDGTTAGEPSSYTPMIEG